MSKFDNKKEQPFIIFFGTGIELSQEQSRVYSNILYSHETKHKDYLIRNNYSKKKKRKKEGKGFGFRNISLFTYCSEIGILTKKESEIKQAKT